jgi:hypothetical protein
MVRRSWILITTLVAALGVMLAAGPARAGSVTAQSIMSKENALGRARALLPAGALVSSSQCQTVEVRIDNERYICSLTYEVPIPGVTPAASSAGSSGASAP